MDTIRNFLRSNRPVVVLVSIILVLTTIPALDIFLILGDSWQGIVPTFTDETLYQARVQTIVHGRTGGNPYFMEHSDGSPLVIFGGAWINAIPQMIGLSLVTATFVNFIIWSVLFALLAYMLFRELRVWKWIAVWSVVLVYIESYAHVWRPANLQPVYSFYFLFYIALIRLIRDQSRRNILFLGLAVGTTFYLFAFLWQIAIITLGLLFLYAVGQKNWLLMRATLLSSFLGGFIGLPIPLYMLWLSFSSPYYWESMGRLGLVNTHLPMAEVIYSGGWIGVVLILLAGCHLCIKAFRVDKEFVLLSVFVAISGLGLWVMQGSNLITGKLLETGEHVRLLILPWLLWSTVSITLSLWQRRTALSVGNRAFVISILVLLVGSNVYFVRQYFPPFLPSNMDHATLQSQNRVAKPFAWLEEYEKSPVVVWSNPHEYPGIVLPTYTKHFALYVYWGMLELVPEDEIRERYLITQYFNNPTLADLTSKNEIGLYLGRGDLFHAAKTVERGIKICRIVFFWDKSRNCGTPPTAQSLRGEKFFSDLETKFQVDIKPNIMAYLKKYHVTYILKDVVSDFQYRPEMLGAVRVYSDDRYELYKLSNL